MRQKMVDKLLTLVKRNYEEIAVEFDLTRKKEVWPKMRELTVALPASASILDLGCGNGRLLEVLPNQVKYLGIDNSEALIRLARENYPGKEFRFGDILELDKLPETDFTTIFCLAVLQHIPGRNLRLKALKQMSAKLVPGGQLIISAWNLWQNRKYRSLLFKNYWLKILGRNKLGFNDLLFPWKNSRGEAVSERYYHAFTKKELKKLARLTGLRIRELKRDRHNYWFILENKNK
jgi:SAM-dependent methyltransferase